MSLKKLFKLETGGGQYNDDKKSYADNENEKEVKVILTDAENQKYIDNEDPSDSSSANGSSKKMPDEVKQRYLKKINSKIKLLAGTTAIILIAMGGLYVYYRYKEHKIDKELQNPVYDQFQSEEFKQVLDDKKYKVFVPDKLELKNHLKSMRSNLVKLVLGDAECDDGTKAEIVHVNLRSILPQNIDNHNLEKAIEVLLKVEDGKPVYAIYFLDNEVAKDISKLLKSDDEYVRAKLPALINETIQNCKIKTARVNNYESKPFFQDLAAQINKAGHNVDWQNFYIRYFSAFEDKKAVHVGYGDENYFMDFAIVCDIHNIDGKITFEIDKTNWIYQSLGQLFRNDDREILPIADYFFNTLKYGKNIEGMDETVFDYDVIIID